MPSSDKSSAVLQGATPTPSAIKDSPHSHKPVQQSLALPSSDPLPVDSQEVASAESVETPSPRMPVRANIKARLWLCIYFPALPLEALTGHKPVLARAVFEDEQGIRRVLLANKQAAAARSIETAALAPIAGKSGT